jgi:hypothetical protein
MTRARWLGLAALLGALAVYYAFVLFPAVFGLVWLALPLRRAPELHLLLVAAATAAIAIALQLSHQTAFASFFKLAAATSVAFWMLRYFESVVWIALVAFIIPLVDIYSVFWGPTSHLIKHPGGVSAFSFAFRFPGEHNYATLGVPDLLFFALFMAAAGRFGLRVAATWLGMIALLGATIALTVWQDVSGLPALPALSLGFLLANGDRIWRSARELGLGIPEPD